MSTRLCWCLASPLFVAFVIFFSKTFVHPLRTHRGFVGLPGNSARRGAAHDGSRGPRPTARRAKGACVASATPENGSQTRIMMRRYATRGFFGRLTHGLKPMATIGCRYATGGVR